MKLSDICVFTGCSYTSGIGLKSRQNDPGLWCNILHTNHEKLKNLQILNAAGNGLENQEIFEQSIELLVTKQPKFLFVAWSEPYRIKLNPGIETYSTGINMAPNSVNVDIKLNHITYPKDYIANIQHRFFDLQNIHYIYITVLNQCRILKGLADLIGTKIYFINTYFDWDDDYFEHISDPTRTPSQLTKYTQTLLNANNRSDDEIFKLYDRIHTEYKSTQGLTNWLNLYNGFQSKYYLDLGDDQLHPGYLSHERFAEFLITQF